MCSCEGAVTHVTCHARNRPRSLTCGRSCADPAQLSAEDVLKEVAKLRGELSAARAKLSGLEATRLGSSSKSASALKETLSTYDATHGELTAVRSALQHIHALVADSGAVDNSAQFQGGAGGRPSSAFATSPPPPLEHRSSAPAKSAQAATSVSGPQRPINLGPITFLSPEDISEKFSVRPPFYQCSSQPWSASGVPSQGSKVVPAAGRA